MAARHSLRLVIRLLALASMRTAITCKTRLSSPGLRARILRLVSLGNIPISAPSIPSHPAVSNSSPERTTSVEVVLFFSDTLAGNWHESVKEIHILCSIVSLQNLQYPQAGRICHQILPPPLKGV